MSLPRKFSASDVKFFVEMLQGSPDISQEKLAGMADLVKLLEDLEYMTDAEIEAEGRKAYREGKR